jgi:uncharacterized protein (DUF427 family)
MSLTDLSLKRKKSQKDFPIIEKSPRKVRVEFNHKVVAVSSGPILLIEYGRGKMPVYFFKKDEVNTEVLVKSNYKGKDEQFQFWHVKVGERLEKNAAYTYSSKIGRYNGLEGYITFKWNSMDHWYEEDEEIFLHPRDPYHRVDTILSSRHIRVEVNGETIAETTRAIFLFETSLPTRYYIPQEDINTTLLVPSKTTSYCPYKGTAKYWSVKVKDEVFENIIWGYPEPIAEIPKIKNYMAFWNEKSDKIRVFVDGKLV